MNEKYNKENQFENIDKKNSVKKKGFVPSYDRKNDNTSQYKVKKHKTKKNITKKTVIIAIVAIVLIVIVSIIGVIILKNINNKELEGYDKLMQDLGLAKLYNNGLANPNEKVEKNEALKVILGTALNTYDITEYMPRDLLYKSNLETTESSDAIDLDAIFNQYSEENKIQEEYQNEYWTKYAVSINFIQENEILINNYNDKVKYIDVISYLANAKTDILGKNLDINVEPDFKDYNNYNNEIKWALSDLVYNEIIENSKSKVNANKTLTKKEVNELAVKFALKYNLITIDDEKININEEKMPSNKDEFAYTLSNIDKNIYEIDTYKKNDNYKNSIDIFADIKPNYKLINEIVEAYYNKILNVDYETISTENFYFEIAQLSMYNIDQDIINKYVEYVKTNNIKISGEAKVQNPIIYFDGEMYRVRTKLTYEILSANELKNVFFKDVEETYTKDKKTIYVDVPVTTLVHSQNYYYVVPCIINDNIAGSVK